MRFIFLCYSIPFAFYTTQFFTLLAHDTSYILTKLDLGLHRKQRSIYLFIRKPFITIQLKGSALEFKSLGPVQECEELITLN